VDVDNRQCMLQVMDTVAHADEPLASWRGTFFSKAEGFVLVYSIADHQSFDNLRAYHQQIAYAQQREPFPLVVCGNKCDLKDDDRQVEQDEGKAMAQQWDGTFLEVSAKTRINIDNIIVALIRQIRRYMQEGRSPVQRPATNARAKRKPQCAVL